MLIEKSVLIKKFKIKQNKMSWKEFLNKFIIPLETGMIKVKNNLSENHDEYLLNVKKWNI